MQCEQHCQQAQEVRSGESERQRVASSEWCAQAASGEGAGAWSAASGQVTERPGTQLAECLALQYLAAVCRALAAALVHPP